jgi:hypothetical protein
MVFVKNDCLSTQCGATWRVVRIYIQSADRQARSSSGDIGCDGRE